MLGAVALVGLKPWADTSVNPHLSGTPGLGATLGDARAVAPAGAGSVAEARVASSGPAVLAAEPVAVSAPVGHGSQPVLAVSAAEAVQPASTAPVVPAPAQPPSSAPTATQPVAAPVSPPPSEPAAAPVLAAGPVESPGSPVTSGGGEVEEEPERECEGDEYAITLSIDSGEILDEESEVDIVVKHLESDGSESEFNLHGPLSAVRDLIAQLVAEGGCVEIGIEPIDEDAALEETLETGVEPTALAETLELASP